MCFEAYTVNGYASGDETLDERDGGGEFCSGELEVVIVQVEFSVRVCCVSGAKEKILI